MVFRPRFPLPASSPVLVGLMKRSGCNIACHMTIRKMWAERPCWKLIRESLQHPHIPIRTMHPAGTGSAESDCSYGPIFFPVTVSLPAPRSADVRGSTS